MTSYHLAQVNIATAKYDLSDARMADWESDAARQQSTQYSRGQKTDGLERDSQFQGYALWQASKKPYSAAT